METNVFLGITLHALGGIAASTCFVPQKGTQRWPYQNFWLLMCLLSWIVMPVAVAYFTVPELGAVISETPPQTMINVTLLGAAYGFGGMAFGLAIRHIGFSLTYSIAIGISAVLGTVIPGIIHGNLIEGFSKAGGGIVLTGFVISLLGVALCGFAGALKEKELAGSDSGFNLKKGLSLVLLAGVLSAVFGVSLSQGAPIDKIAEAHGAKHFQGNAKFIFAMGGAFITNLIWWSFVHFKNKTWKKYVTLPPSKTKSGSLTSHYFFAILAGVLWYLQFFFYGLGHVRMGDYQFISWGVHMAMLIFFSFGIGLILKEWKELSSKTISALFFGLLILLTSFGLITYGSYIGEQSAKTSDSSNSQYDH